MTPKFAVRHVTDCGMQPGKTRVLFVFVALRPKSTTMVMAGRSVHVITLFPGQA